MSGELLWGRKSRFKINKLYSKLVLLVKKILISGDVFKNVSRCCLIKHDSYDQGRECANNVL